MAKLLKNGSILPMGASVAPSSKISLPRHRQIAQYSDRDSGVNAIESLMERQGAFDYILLETTGLADPGAIAPLFWVDDGLGSSIYLDGIVTLVDAKNVLDILDEKMETPRSLDDAPSQEHAHGPHLTTAHLQISHADVIILNKSDTISPENLEVIKARLQGINSLARLHITQYSQIPELESVLLDIHAYDGVELPNFDEKGHSHLDPVSTPCSIYQFSPWP